MGGFTFALSDASLTQKSAACAIFSAGNGWRDLRGSNPNFRISENQAESPCKAEKHWVSCGLCERLMLQYVAICCKVCEHFLQQMQQIRTARSRKPARKTKGPLRVVRSGSVTVKIYRGENAVKSSTGKVHRYAVFTIAFFEGTERRQRRFANFDDAIREAERIALRLNQGEHRVLQLTSADASSYVQAMETLKPLGVPLHSAVSEYVHAAKMLEGRTLAEAAKDFVQRNRAKVTERTVPEVVDELLTERAGKSLRYRQSLRSHLNRFKASFQTQIGRVSTL